MRVILDTNVLMSALLSPAGAPAKLLDAWERRLFTLVACGTLVAEFLEVAGRAFFRAKLQPGTVELVAADLRDRSLFCRDLPAVQFTPDPKDGYLLALAEVSDADFLVTGDKELLAAATHMSTRIITAAAMLHRLKDSNRPGVK